MRSRAVVSWLVCSWGLLSQAGCGQREDVAVAFEAPPQEAQAGPWALPPPHFRPGSFCDPSPFGQWCYYNPRPSGVEWTALGGKDHEIWVGGSSVDALHFDGHDWSRVETGLVNVGNFAEFSPHDVWVVGQTADAKGTIVHFDGGAFTTSFQEDLEFLDVWGANPHDVYAVGLGGAQHWNGTAWTPVAGVLGQSVSGTGPHDVWIANFDGLQHFDGTSWQPVPDFQGAFVIAVAAISHNDVWVAAGHNGATDVEHFDGQTWTVSTSIPSSAPIDVLSLGAGGPHDVWVVGSHFTGPTQEEHGMLMHYDGHAWTELADPPGLVWRMASIGHDDLAVGRAGEILQLDADRPIPFRNLTEGPTADLKGVWGSHPRDMWAVGASGTVLHYDGHIVRSLQVAHGGDLTAVWGTGHDDVWVVGAGGTVLHFHGLAAWPVDVGTTQDLFAVYTAAHGDVWMGGAGSTLLHLQGGMVTPVSLPGLPSGSDIFVLNGLGADDVWVGGHSPSGGFVSHWNGSAWSPADFVTGGNPSIYNRPVARLWELAPDDVWVITTLGVANNWEYLHFDGTTWTASIVAPSPDTWMFNGAEPNVASDSFGFGPDDVWSVGGLGAWRRRTPIP